MKTTNFRKQALNNQNFTRENILDKLRNKHPRECAVLMFYFGYLDDDSKKYTIREISGILNLTFGRIKQLLIRGFNIINDN